MNRSLDWFRQAKRDREKGNIDIEHAYYEWACFSFQQASEKGVKNVYQHKNMSVRGHSIVKLLEGLSEIIDVREDILHAGRVLDRYYLEGRYPNGFPAGSPSDFFDEKIALEARDASDKILGFCADIIS